MRRWRWLIACVWVAACSGSVDEGGPPLNPDASLDGAAPSGDATVNGPDGAPADGSLDASADAPLCTADLLTDPNNCGACAHDCSAGKCIAGLCRLTGTEFTMQGGAELALTNDRVVFTLQGNYIGAFSCPKQGCGPSGPKRLTVDIDPSAFLAPSGVATYGDYVYWTDYLNSAPDGVYRTPLDGGASVRVSKGDTYQFSTTVAVSDAGIFWTNSGMDQPVAHCPLAMCGDAAASQYPVVAGGSSRGLVIADDGSIVWTENASLVRCANAACSGGPVAALLGVGAALAVDGNTLYYANNIVHEIRSCPVAGCSAATSVVIDGQLDIVHALVASKGFLYWVYEGTAPADGGLTTDGFVRRCEIARCAATVKDIATAQAAPTDLAVDDQSVYWINSGRLLEIAHPSAVMKAPR